MALDEVIDTPWGKMTKEKIVCMALNYGNEINKSRLMQWLKVENEEDMLVFLNTYMSKKDWQFVQGVWKYLDSFWPEVAQIEEDITGVPLTKVEAQEFEVVLRDGEVLKLEGGYYPIRYDPKKSLEAREQEQDITAQSQMSGYSTFGMRLGNTKNRAKSMKIDRALDLSFGVISGHTNDVLHIISHRKAVRDVWRIVSNDRFGAMVDATYGDGAQMFMKDWAKKVWMEPRLNNGFGDMSSLMSTWRKNTVGAIMAHRVSTMILNFSNIGPMIDKLGNLSTLRAFNSFFTMGEIESNRDFILSKSVFLRERSQTMDNSITELSKMSAPGRWETVDKVSEKAFAGLIWTDAFTSFPAWLQSYKESFNRQLKAGKNAQDADRLAIAEADSVVRSMIGSGQVKDRANVQDKSELNKTLFMFYSYFNAQLNAVAYEYLKSRNTGNYIPFMQTMLYRVVLVSAIETVIRSMISGDDEDDFMEEWLSNSIGLVCGWGGALGGVAELGIKKALGLNVYASGKGAPIAVDALQRSINTMTAKESDLIDVGREVTRLANVVLPDSMLLWPRSHTITDALWTTARYFDNDKLLSDWEEWLHDVVFDKKPRK